MQTLKGWVLMSVSTDIYESTSWTTTPGDVLVVIRNVWACHTGQPIKGRLLACEERSLGTFTGPWLCLECVTWLPSLPVSSSPSLTGQSSPQPHRRPSKGKQDRTWRSPETSTTHTDSTLSVLARARCEHTLFVENHCGDLPCFSDVQQAGLRKVRDYSILLFLNC